MCGRFSLSTSGNDLISLFSLDEIPESYHERYNIAPSQPVVVLSDRRVRKLDYFRWGLIPHWAKDAKIGNRLINARSETIDEKPSFRNAFKKRRCLIIADGFYEWKKGKDGKQPIYIRLKNSKAFAFAGLWEVWTDPESGEVVHSCTIITCEPNELMAKFHHRMPVILSPDDYDHWLDVETSEPDKLKALLKPYPADKMEAYPVSKLVNFPGNDSPDIIKPAK